MLFRSHAIAKIEENVEVKHPIAIFEEDVVKRLLDRWNLKDEVHKTMHYYLCKIVQDADQVIKRAFQVREEVDQDGEKVTYRRAHWDVSPDYCTYLPFNESVLPWDDEPKLVKTVVPVNQFSIQRATNAELRALRQAWEEVKTKQGH